MASPELIARLYRSHLPSFARFAFRELHDGVALRDHWSIDLKGDALANLVQGSSRRLIVNVPPRALKSHCASVALPVFALGRRPDQQIMVVAGSRELRTDLRARVLRLLRAPRCRSLLPHLDTQPRPHAITTSAGGSITFAVVGGRLIGRGADLIIVDDPISPNDALDARKRKAVQAWFDAEVTARLNSKSTGAIALVMQRVHHDDLTAHLLAHGGWPRLVLPAIATRDERWTLSSGRVVTRCAGEPLHPEQESKEQLRDLLVSMGAVHFAAQYQQAPLHNTSGWRNGTFYYPRPEGWTPGQPLPHWFIGRVRELDYMLHKLFDGPKPPSMNGLVITPDEILEAVRLHQESLIASLQGL